MFLFSNLQKETKLYDAANKKLTVTSKKTPGLLDVEELSAWISKSYRFELDEEKQNEKVNVVTQAAIQSAKRDTYIDCWDDLLTGKLSIKVTQQL